MHHTLRQVEASAKHYKAENPYRFMVVRDMNMYDGGMTDFMGAPIRTISLWKHKKEVVLFVSLEQRDLFLKAFPRAEAV